MMAGSMVECWVVWWVDCWVVLWVDRLAEWTVESKAASMAVPTVEHLADDWVVSMVGCSVASMVECWVVW